MGDWQWRRVRRHCQSPHRLRARIGLIGQDAFVGENLIDYENLKPFRILNLMNGKLRR